MPLPTVRSQSDGFDSRVLAERRLPPLCWQEGVLLVLIGFTCLFQQWDPHIKSLPYLSFGNLRIGIIWLLFGQAILLQVLRGSAGQGHVRSTILWSAALMTTVLASGDGSNRREVWTDALRGAQLSSVALMVPCACFMRERAISAIIAVMVWAAAAMAVLAVLEFQYPLEFVRLRVSMGIVDPTKQMEYIFEKRAAVFWNNAPALGSFLALTVPLSMLRLHRARDGIPKLVAFVHLALIVVGLGLAGSRGPLLATAVGLILYGWRTWGKPVLALAFVIGVLLVPQVLREGIREVDATNPIARLPYYKRNLDGRVDIWSEALLEVRGSEIWRGIGYGEWWRRYGYQSRRTEFTRGVRVLHNTYLTMFIETGVLGLTVQFLFLATLCWRTLFPGRPTPQDGAPHVFVCWLSVCSMVICSVADSALMTSAFMHLYFALAGIIWMATARVR